MPYYSNSTPDIPLTNLTGKGTKIIGRIYDSGNQPISSGWIEFTADDFIVDGTTTNKTLVIPKPRRFNLTGESLNIELVNSQYSEATYRIRVGETTGGVDTIYADFHAMVPYGKVIDISDLTPSKISRESLPSTVFRVAEIIMNSPELSNSLRNIFTFRGNWAANTIYSPFDLVFVPGSPNRTFVCTLTHTSPATFNSANWQQVI